MGLQLLRNPEELRRDYDPCENNSHILMGLQSVIIYTGIPEGI